MKNKTKYKCVVCGARCRNGEFETCDSTCMQAKKNIRTRMQQFQAEMRRDAVVARFEEQAALNRRRQTQKVEENEHYNRPYLCGATMV